MICLNNRFIRLFACISLAIFSVNADAQVSLIKNTIDKLEGCRNFSYQYVEKTLDFTNDAKQNNIGTDSKKSQLFVNLPAYNQ